MDKETITLIIAQNGLGTAQTILTAKAAKLRKRAEKAAGDEIDRLKAQAHKAERLAAALRIANEGVAEYMAEFGA